MSSANDESHCCSDLHGQLLDMREDDRHWKCALWFDESDAQNGSKMVNLCDYLVPPVQESTKSSTLDTVRLKYAKKKAACVFPKRFQGLSSKKQLVKELQGAAVQCGYGLACRQTNNKPLSNTRQAQFAMWCVKGTRIHKSQVKLLTPLAPGEKRATAKITSLVPEKEDRLCKFRFTVYLTPDSHPMLPGRWMLSPITPKPNGRPLFHNGHEKIKTKHVHVPLKCLTDEETQLNQDCSDLHISDPTKAALLTKRNKSGFTIKSKQLHYLSNKLKDEVCSKLTANATSAEKMIKTLNDRGDVSWLMVTYTPIAGIMAWHKVGPPVPIELRRKPKPAPKQLFLKNKLGRGDRLLLCFMFAHDEELRLTKMHPEFMAADTVNSTNNENREVATFAFLDGNNSAFQGARAYMPSGKKWVFNMIFSHLLPLFWGKAICNRIRLIATDGDSCEYTAVNNAIAKGVYPNAVSTLCYYHTFVQQWNGMVRQHIPKTEAAKDTAETAYCWIKTWFFYVESREEYDYSVGRFNSWLAEQAVVLSQTCVDAIDQLIREKLEGHELQWLNYHKLLEVRMVCIHIQSQMGLSRKSV